MDGTRYEGQFKDGEPNGQGTYISEDKQKYEGEWIGGMLSDASFSIGQIVSQEKFDAEAGGSGLKCEITPSKKIPAIEPPPSDSSGPPSPNVSNPSSAIDGEPASPAK